MEKVHSNIEESISLASLMKNISGKAAKNSSLRTKSDVNFKDLIRPKNNESNQNATDKNIFGKRQDSKDVKGNVSDARRKGNDFKTQNTEDKSVKDDISSNTAKAADKNSDKSSKVDKGLKKDNKPNEKIEDKKQKDYEETTKEIVGMINNPSVKPEEIATKLKEMMKDFEGDISKIIDSLSNISPKLADDIKNIFKMLKNQNLSDQKLLNFISDIKEDEQIQKAIISLNSDNASNLDKSLLKDENPLEDLKQMLDETIDKNTNSSENSKVSSKDNSNIKLDFEDIMNNDNSQGLKDALFNLKNDVFVQNAVSSENLQDLGENIENIEDSNINSTSLNIPAVKILGQSKTVFTTGTVNSNSQANLATFTKIVDEMRLAFRDNKTDFTMKLEPETLGKMSVKINSENGIFNASFFVESEKVKQMIENQLVMLRQAMLDKGINIQDINVQVGQNNEDLNYHKHIMEAKNYSKRENMDIDTDFDLDTKLNPYIKDELFDERV